MGVRIIHGSALALPLPDDSVDLIVTSPPYFALRNYTDDGNPLTHQVGAEATPAEYVDALIAATREAVRVLKPSGSLWVNLGDKYSQRSAGARSSHQSGLFPDRPELAKDWKRDRAAGLGRMPYENITDPATGAHVPEKSLMGLPWRYALRCIDDLGLILRAEVIWDKPNGLPESVRDRVRRSHEQWFHFTLSPRYYANVDEVREPYSGQDGGRGVPYIGRQDSAASTLRVESPNPLGKLPGSVWRIATQPLRVPAELGIDHFAAFPMEWPRRIITGWSPPGICTACGEGRRAVVDRERVLRSTSGEGFRDDDRRTIAGGAFFTGADTTVTLTGYACACPTPDAPTRPAVVLDPFGGTGTTALVADVLGRDGISVDLSADYCRLATWRTADPRERARVLKARAPMQNTEPAQAGNPPERNTHPMSKMTDERLLTGAKRATTGLARVDKRVAKAQTTIDELEDTRAKAQATIDGAEGEREEFRAQLAYLRTIAKGRSIDLDAELAKAPAEVEEEDAPAATASVEPVAGVPAFSQ